MFSEDIPEKGCGKSNVGHRTLQLLQVFKINICAFARMIERGKKGVLAMKAKLCGMKTREAAEAAEAAGADLVGFIFWAKSRRAVTPEQAAAIGASLRRAKKVGVFVDAPVARVNEIAAACGLDFVQLHGHEDADYARQVRAPVIKAYRFGDGFDARGGGVPRGAHPARQRNGGAPRWDGQEVRLARGGGGRPHSRDPRALARRGRRCGGGTPRGRRR